jgi:hydroxymethylbilane synthase
MQQAIRIGTRDSKLALWQAHTVQALLEENGAKTELVPVKSEGDLDLVTPLYAMGVQGVFTKGLDAFLLSNKIDIAVHSLKDVPTQLAVGLAQAAVLPRASYKDLFVPHPHSSAMGTAKIATGSIRRRAQWLHQYPGSTIENLRGNVQTRMRKLEESDWDGAIFAAAGLDRMEMRPANAIELDWMLPAPAQGAVMVACRAESTDLLTLCKRFNDEQTALCVQIERDFLRSLMGGCSTPISALAEIVDNEIHFKGNILSVDGSQKMEIQKTCSVAEAKDAGIVWGKELLQKGADIIVESIRNFGQNS